MSNVKAIESYALSREYGGKRYIIVDAATGEVLDDAQGYGFKTPQKAYACYSYKTRDKSKDSEKKKKEQHIRNWMKANKSFMNLLEGLAFDIAKEACGPEDKVNAKFVKELLKENNLEPDFTAGELLKVWVKGNSKR